jgi:hypothetical protein
MIQSVLQYVLLALGLVASLALFFSLKHEIQANTRKHRQKIEEMIARLDEAAKAAELAAPPMEVFVRAPCPGFNLNQRAQALRLLRRCGPRGTPKRSGATGSCATDDVRAAYWGSTLRKCAGPARPERESLSTITVISL